MAVGLAALACAAASSAAPSSVSTQELTVTGSGGVQLACGLTLPTGSPPAGGWPGLLLFPGFFPHAFLERLAETTFAPAGFASLACDERGTGSSGGSADLAGPADVGDARALFDWLAARPDVSDTEIGAYGESAGGAEVWNAAVAGVPFKAIVPVDTWTSLGEALDPHGVAKGITLGAFSSIGPNDPAALAPRSAALALGPDVHDPGPARPRLRPRPGDRRVQAPRGAEAPLHRHRRPRQPCPPEPRHARGRRLVPAVPRKRPGGRRRRRARAHAVGRGDDVVRRAPADSVRQRQPPGDDAALPQGVGRAFGATAGRPARDVRGRQPHRPLRRRVEGMAGARGRRHVLAESLVRHPGRCADRRGGRGGEDPAPRRERPSSSRQESSRDALFGLRERHLRGRRAAARREDDRRTDDVESLRPPARRLPLAGWGRPSGSAPARGPTTRSRSGSTRRSCPRRSASPGMPSISTRSRSTRPSTACRASRWCRAGPSGRRTDSRCTSRRSA